MPTREEMISFLESKSKDESAQQSQVPSREEMISHLQNKAKEDPSLLSRLGGAISSGVDTLSSYTSAPTRAAIGKLQDGGSVADSGQAFVNQFGEHTEFAPTGKEIMQRAGVTDRPMSDFIPGTKYAGGGIVANPFDSSVSGAAGLALDVVADPTLLVPFGLIGKGAKAGATAIKEMSAVEKVSQAVADALKVVPKENAKEILEAAKRLNIKVTPGMLDGSETIAQLEQTLAKSPSVFSTKIKNAQNAVESGVAQGVDKIVSEKTTLSPYEVGNEFKSGLTAKVGERLDPISSVFNDVAESTKNIPVSDKSKEAIIRNIEKTPEYYLTGGEGLPGQYVQRISRIRNADDAKKVMTMLNKDIEVAIGSEKQALLSIKSKVGTLEKNSIMRGAITAAREGGMRTSTGELIGKEVVGDLKEARSGYRELAKDLNQISENARANFGGGPGDFLNQVEKIPNEEIQKKFFNAQNLRQIQNLKDTFPEQFQLLKQGKLQEIVEKSLVPVSKGDKAISANRFITEANKLGPEAKKLLFGENVQVLNDVETIQRSLPKDFNPSNTANQAKWNKEALMSNVSDVPNYLRYKYMSNSLKNEVLGGTKAVQKSVAPIQLTEKANALKGIQAGLKQVVQTEQLKGVEKWIANGQQRVIETDASLDPQFLEQVKSNKKFKDQLIRAGDKSTGQNRLNEIIESIKSSEEYKKFQKEKEKQAQGKEPDQAKAQPQIKFPLVVRKTGQTAVVRNISELDEAKSEGWA